MSTVMITGSSTGIGAAAVERFASAGWNVVATMRTPDPARHADHGKVLVTRLDVKVLPTIEAAIAAAIERFGRIDVVVNNAGYGQHGVFEAISPAQIRQQFDVNVFGPMHVMQAALPHLHEAGGGVVVNVSSGAGLYGLPLASMYCASKFALEGFSEAVAYELRAVGVQMKLVIPYGGISDTRFTPNMSMANPPEAYAAYVMATNKDYANASSPSPKPAAEVADTIYAAATDGTDRLRYLVGNDTRGLIDASELPWIQREERLRELLG